MISWPTVIVTLALVVPFYLALVTVIRWYIAPALSWCFGLWEGWKAWRAPEADECSEVDQDGDDMRATRQDKIIASKYAKDDRQ